jgi:hypothetical protein
MPNFLQCTWEYIKEGIFSKPGELSLNAVDCPNVYKNLTDWQPFFKDVFVMLVTLGVLVAVTAGYLALKPTVVIDQTFGNNQCPDQWVYRPEDSMCHPLYSTSCAPFNPDVQRGNQCDIAKRCQTTWKGLCD